jgi:hypothetical protein
VDPSGFVLVYGARSSGRGQGALRADERIPIIYRFRFDGTLVDTIVPPEASFPRAMRIGNAVMPFTERHLAAWSPLGYFVTARTATYAVDLPLPPRDVRGGPSATWREGDPVASIRHSAPPVRVHDAERSDWRRSITMFNRSPSPGRNSNWQWSGPDIPRVKPPIRALTVDRDGRIWVRLSQQGLLDSSVPIPTRPATPAESYGLDAPRRWPEPLAFDVFEPTGRYIGQVRFPPDVGLTAHGGTSYAVAGDTVWAVIQDQDDVPTVKRYRIRWDG